MKKATRSLAALIVLVWILPALPAAAAVLTISPTQFRSENTEVKYFQTPLAITIHPNSAETYAGYAFFSLPVGSVITEVKYFHYSGGQNTTCELERKRQNPTSNNIETLAHGSSSMTTGGDYSEVTLVPNNGADLTVRAHYRYIIHIGITKGAGIGPVKVSYQPPTP